MAVEQTRSGGKSRVLDTQSFPALYNFQSSVSTKILTFSSFIILIPVRNYTFTQ